MKNNRLLNFLKSKFSKNKGIKKIGINTKIPNDLIVSGGENITIGSCVYIGPRCLFYSKKSSLTIGNHVMLGPEVMIITGDHRFDIEGKLMDEITDEMKLPENDKPVRIQDDCWIGARSLILKGVTIGPGSIIAAGATVLNDVPPYSIYYCKGNIKPRFKKDIDIK